jgi:hypothetical protein
MHCTFISIARAKPVHLCRSTKQLTAQLCDWIWVLVSGRNSTFLFISSVGIAIGYGLGGMGSISVRSKKFSLLHSVQTGSGAHPTSYPMGTGNPVPGSKET